MVCKEFHLCELHTYGAKYLVFTDEIIKLKK